MQQARNIKERRYLWSITLEINPVRIKVKDAINKNFFEKRRKL